MGLTSGAASGSASASGSTSAGASKATGSAGSAGTSVGGAGSGGGSKEKLQCEYAKSGKSTCRGCNEKIEKGAVRLAFFAEPESGKYGGLVPAWHHVKCFFERNLDMATAVSDFEGYESLDKKDVKEIEGFLPKKQTAGDKSEKKSTSRKRKQPAKSEPTSDEEPPISTNTKPKGKGKSAQPARSSKRQKKEEEEEESKP
ncbi:Poly [ADP-ribose] polymerase 1, partial [Quaeritorhiza haematococci]